MNSMRVKYPTDNSIVSIGAVREGRYTNVIFMAKITDEQLDALSCEQNIIVGEQNAMHEINLSNIYLAGPVDLNDEESVDEIRNVRNRWCSDSHGGSFIPRNYDYKTNTGDLITVTEDLKQHNICATVETFDNLKMFMFGHAKLGYPKNIVVFKKVILSR